MPLGDFKGSFKRDSRIFHKSFKEAEGGLVFFILSLNQKCKKMVVGESAFILYVIVILYIFYDSYIK